VAGVSEPARTQTRLQGTRVIHEDDLRVLVGVGTVLLAFLSSGSQHTDEAGTHKRLTKTH
jgi:hypothetical protein